MFVAHLLVDALIMAWVVSYQQDTEAPGVGTLTAKNGLAVVSARVDTNDGEANAAFMQQCVEAEQRQLKMAGDSAAVVAKIEAILNGA